MIENVAVLFTDIVGSTALAQELSPEGADAVRRDHFSTLRQAVAESGGTEVKNLGDGLMVVFTSASSAITCAVAMQQGVDRANRSVERPVGLRVGLSVGEVTREDDDYFGDAVVEAARLCAHCNGGEVLAADIVRLMAGRRNRHECVPVGPFSLKGLTDPVDAVRVAWEPLGVTSTAVPLPTRLSLAPTLGMVGRSSEVEALRLARKRVAVGPAREVVLVSGEAGMGKTTLVADAARAAIDDGMCVLFGHCEEDPAGSYQLFAEALGHYVTHAPEEVLRAHVDQFGSELGRMVPALASRIPGLPRSTATDSDTERYLLFAAVVGLLGQISTDRPVVLVLDDLQWAGAASLQLLRHVIASTPQHRLLVLGTYRDSELSHTHPLLDTLAALHRTDGVERIELSGLDDSGVVALMEAAAGQAIGGAAVGLAHAVYRETDGNPFFVTEVLRHLAETGAVHQDATGRWVGRQPLDQVALPDSVREVIGARVGRLGERAGRVLAMASVIGRDFDLDVLALAADTSEDEALDVLDAAELAALVREASDTAGRYTFAHALIQHTLYEDLGPTRRARGHRRVAEALEDLSGDRPGARVGELARHWLSATQPVDVDRAVGYARQAGDAALFALAPGDAVRYYSQALELAGPSSDPALRMDLAIGLGNAQRQTGDPTFRTTLLAVAREASDRGDTERLVAAALANNRGWFSAVGVIDAEKVTVLESAAERLPVDHVDRALVLATLCAELTVGADLDRLQSLADEAVALAESSGDDATVVRVLNLVYSPMFVPPLLHQSLAWTADALERAERLGDPVLHYFAAAWRFSIAARAGDIEEMDRCLGIVGDLATRLGQPTMRWRHLFNLGMRALLAGDTDRAEQFATEALEVGTEGGEPDASVFYGGQLMAVCHQRGTLGELVPLMQQLDSDTPDIVPAMLSALLAIAHTEAEQLDEARRLLDGFAASGFSLPMDHTWVLGMAYFAEAGIECADPGLAAPLLDRLRPFADQIATGGGALVYAPLSHYVGGLAAVCGRFDEAEAAFSKAAAFSDRVGARFMATRTDLLWGRMRTVRGAPGDLDAARSLLERALTTAEAAGYATVGRRAEAALDALGPN